MLVDREDDDPAPVAPDRVDIMTAATPITEMIDVVLAATEAERKYLRGGGGRDTRRKGGE